MAEQSPKHKLTRGQRGWYRWVAGRTRWVCSTTAAPTGEVADAIFEARFAQLASPPRPRVSATIADLFNAVAEHRAKLGRSPRLVADYTDAGRRLMDVLGESRQAANLGPADFSYAAAAWGAYAPSRRAKLVIVTRSAYRCAVQLGIIDRMPDFGLEFKPPTRAEFRRHRAKKGERFYSTKEIAALLKRADRKMRVAILLALNGGFGNTDCATLPWDAVDLKGGWIVFPRGKTGIARRVPLWPETVKAIKALHREGPTILVGERGAPLISDSGASHNDRLAVAFDELCAMARVTSQGFYSLKRTHRTLADETGDQRAAALICGHEVGDIGGIYVQHVSDERLRRVVTYVHERIFGRPDRAPAAGTSKRGQARRGAA